MYCHNYTPSNFNISLVTPIPKKGDLKEPSDFRPISVSTAYAMIYERLLLMSLTINHLVNHLKKLEIRQNILIKQAIGLSRYCKTSPLNQALNLDSITSIYLKHKLFFLRQIKEIKITNDVFNYLSAAYNNLSIHVQCFNNQLNVVNKRLAIDNCSANIENSINLINSLSYKNSIGLVESIKFLINFYSASKQSFIMLTQLSMLLNYEFYA